MGNEIGGRPVGRIVVEAKREFAVATDQDRGERVGEEVAGRTRDDTELGEKIAHGRFGAGEKGPVGEIGAVGGGVGFQDGGRVVDGVERQRDEGDVGQDFFTDEFLQRREAGGGSAVAAAWATWALDGK